MPKIRFPEFTDAWEQRKSHEIFQTITDYVANGSFASLRENVSYSKKKDFAIVVRLTDYSNKYKGPFLYTSELGYKFLKKSSLVKGDILISNVGANAGLVYRAPNMDVPMTLGPNSILVRSDGNDTEFLYQMMKTTYGEKKIKEQIGISAQPKFNKTEFRQIDFFLPSNDEQKQIGTMFSQLDKTIALHQRQLENYKELKKLMLQKIFNRELCFKDENGNDYPEWEEIALKELGETFTGLSGKTKENFGKGKGKFVTYMNVFSNPIANLAMTENVEIKDGEKQNEVCYGDIFFTTSSETPDEVGMSSVWLSHESNVYLNSFCFGYRLNSESESKVISQFLGAQLRAEHIRKEIVLLAQGSTRFNISKAKLIEIPLYLPVIQEQQKIADFLSMLDVRIEQLSQKVELLKEQKKGLMQKMFV